MTSARIEAWLPNARSAAFFTAVVPAAATWSFYVSQEQGSATDIWFPNALLAAALIRHPFRQWAMWCLLAGIGTAGANLLNGKDLLLSCALVLPNSAEALIAAVLLRRYQPDGTAFDRIGTPLVLIVAAGIVAPAISAAIGAGVLHVFRQAPFAPVAETWFGGSAVGQLILLPVMLSVSGAEWQRLVETPARAGEFLLWTLFALSTTLLMRNAAAPFVFIELPLVLAALRLPLFQSLLVNLLNTVVLVWLVGAGYFPLKLLDVGNQPLLGYLPAISTVIPAFVLGTVQNVRERERDRERRALAISEARWKLALEGAEFGVWDWNVVDGSMFFSKRWKAMFGYDEHEIPDSFGGWAKLVHPDDLPLGLEALRGCFEHKKGNYYFEQRLRCKDGSYKWILVRGKAIEWNADGSPRRMIGTHTNVTREREAAVERSRLIERMTLAMQAARIGVFEWSLLSGAMLCDERMHEIYGISKDEDGTRPETWTGRIHPDDAGRAQEIIRLALRGEMSFDSMYKIVLPDGSVRHLKLLANVVRGVDGRVVRVVGCNWDISDSVLAQESLRQANERLRRSNEEVAAANHEVRNFAYIVSHDLRAPLVNIRGFAGELRYTFNDIRAALTGSDAEGCPEFRERLSRLIDGDINEALDFIDSSVGRMGGLIEAILRLSRLGQQQMQVEAVDLEDLTRTILKSLYHDIERAEGEVSLSPMPVVMADRSAMEQILGNLLSNAVKYRVLGRPLRITIRASVTQTHGLTMEVRDNGRGMAAEDIPRAFDLFRRIGAQDTVGEGMGLAYVQALVRRYDGHIACESVLGEGTTFGVSLPGVRPLSA